MNTVTQTMLYSQALINYANKKGVTKATIRYKTNRRYYCKDNILDNIYTFCYTKLEDFGENTNGLIF